MSAQGLSAADIRSLFQLLGELRELGARPSAWRQHLALELERLCGARAVCVSELQPNSQPRGAETRDCRDAVSVLDLADTGVPVDERAAFYEDVVWYEHDEDDPLAALLTLYGSSFTRERRSLASDPAWYRSALANERFRRQNCDDFVFSMQVVPRLSVFSSFEAYKAWGDRPFTGRDLLFMELLHEQLATDWQPPSSETQLSRRLRQVRDLLCTGASEKQIADQLAVSAHTAHDYVKTLYRKLGVHSRAELVARASRQRPAPRTRLAAETAA